MIRIVLTGAECTGKTTLAKALANHYSEPWTDEYARRYVEEVRRPLNSDDVEPIARGQLAEEDSILGEARRFTLHDTNLLSTIIYAKHYYSLELEWLNNAFLQRDYALYLFTAPNGIEWEADLGQRDSAEARDKLHHQFRQSLFRLHLPTVELRGNQRERFSEAIQAIDQVLSV